MDGKTLPSRISHNYAHLHDMRLHYVAAGTGPLVILLHGLPAFWYSWRKQIPALANHFRVVATDLRGYNLSDKPIGVEHYKPSVVTEDIRQFIHHLNEDDATIIGHDWGGATC